MKCQKSKIFEHVRKRSFPTKGQGMPLNVIIIAAVVLIVLIVLWAIFTGKMGGFTRSVTEQEAASKVEAYRIGALAKGVICINSIGKTCTSVTTTNCASVAGCKVEGTGAGAKCVNADAPKCEIYNEADCRSRSYVCDINPAAITPPTGN